MDRPLTLTKEMLVAILEAAQIHNVLALSVTDVDVANINQDLAQQQVQGPAVIIDISNPVGIQPGHLASTLNGFGNYLSDIAEETKKHREATEKLYTTLVATPTDASIVASILTEIRDAIRSLADGQILAQPLPPAGGGEVDQAAERVLQALARRPDLLEDVRRRLDAA